MRIVKPGFPFGGEEGDSVVGKVNNMGGGDGRDDIFNSTCDFEFDSELYLL